MKSISIVDEDILYTYIALVIELTIVNYTYNFTIYYQGHIFHNLLVSNKYL